MPYIGVSPVTRGGDDFIIDNFAAGADFTAGSSTQLTLSSSPATENAILVSMDGVTQHHNTFSLSSTTLTFSEAIPTGVSNIEVQYYIKTTLNTISSGAINSSAMLDDNVVITSKIADLNITTAKLSDNSITSAKLSGDLVAPGDLTVTDNFIMDVGTVSASATQTQVGGTAITTDNVLISTCATAGDSVTLPSAVAGRSVWITNSGAAAAWVWPASGDAINEGTTDARDPAPLWPNESREYRAHDATGFYTPRPSGSRVLLDTQTASTSASLDFADASMGDGTFDVIEVIGTNIIPSVDGQGLEMLVSDDLGVTYETAASYNYSGYDSNQAGALIGNYNASQVSFVLMAGGAGNAAGESGVSFDMHCQMANASTFFSYHCRGTYVQDVPGYRTFNSGGNFLVAAAYNGLQFKFGGNMASGTIAVYGINK